MKTETEPDDKRLYDQFRASGMDGDGALTAVHEIRTMAGQNILAKMDVQTAKLEAQYVRIESKIQTQNRIIGFFGSGIALFIAALNIAIYVITK
jgi:hypothetical protein